MDDNSFLGKGWAFPPNFEEVNKTNEMVEKEVDIHQSLIILLGTVPGERIMHFEYGCNLKQFLFESISPSLFARMRMVITDSIVRFEARIKLEKIDFKFEDSVLYITINYKIRQTNVSRNLVYPFYIMEGGNL